MSPQSARVRRSPSTGPGGWTRRRQRLWEAEAAAAAARAAPPPRRASPGAGQGAETLERGGRTRGGPNQGFLGGQAARVWVFRGQGDQEASSMESRIRERGCALERWHGGRQENKDGTLLLRLEVSAGTGEMGGSGEAQPGEAWPL